MRGSKLFESKSPLETKSGPIPEFAMEMFGLKPGSESQFLEPLKKLENESLEALKKLENEKEAYPFVDRYIENTKIYDKFIKDVESFRESLPTYEKTLFEKKYCYTEAKKYRHSA